MTSKRVLNVTKVLDNIFSNFKIATYTYQDSFYKFISYKKRDILLIHTYGIDHFNRWFKIEIAIYPKEKIWMKGRHIFFKMSPRCKSYDEPLRYGYR
jgi:hypothetical protein